MDKEMEKIVENLADDVQSFRDGGEMSADLQGAMWDYLYNRGEIRNYNCGAEEFCASRLAGELGL